MALSSANPAAPRLPAGLWLAGLLVVAAIAAPLWHGASAPAPGAVHSAAAKLAKPAIAPVVLAQKPASAFAIEAQLTHAELMARWDPLINAASQRMGVPADWIRDVMRAESGGRTMLAENTPIVSDMGAQGLMQLLPGTYAEMRAQYGLGANVFDPRDNILAGAAYLKWLKGKYGFPAMFAAYNDGPGLFEDHLFRDRPLPDETKLYVANITKSLGSGTEWLGNHDKLTVTRPDGTKLALARNDIRGVRPVLPGEYAPGILAVIDLGRTKQGVMESPVALQAALNGMPRNTKLASLH